MRVSQKNKNKSVTLCALCPYSPVYAVLLSDRWRQYELISSPCSDSPLLTTECLQVTPSVGSSLSWDRLVYSAATFPAIVWSQLKLDLKERATTNGIKLELAQTAAVDLLPNEFDATANVSLLARLQKLSVNLIEKFKVFKESFKF